MQSFGRKPNRAKEHNYSDEGYYFITICIKDKKEFFGEVRDGEMRLNKLGKIVNYYWMEIPKHYSCVQLDEYIIMPNHIHGIIIINTVENVGTGQCPVPTKYGKLSKIIKSFKEAVIKNAKVKYKGNFQWQRSFYDRIIRNDEELVKIRDYIENNPLKWDLDKNNSENLFM